MLIIQKFGGSSVADKEKIMRVAGIIRDNYERGHKLVVVLSAQGDTTDRLLEKASELNPSPSKRELDMLLATGEQQSITLMALALDTLGIPAISLNARQIGIMTNSEHGNAKITSVDVRRITKELNCGKIVLAAGFQGVNDEDDITTLGRGGSDTTAVGLAAVLSADICEIYTDVDGVFTADPRIVRNAKKLDEISYDEMLELATLGAKVLHNRSVEIAKGYKVEMCVRSSFSGAEGTRITEYERDCFRMEKKSIVGCAGDLDVCKIAVKGISGEGKGAYGLFTLLARHCINVDIIIQSVRADSSRDITFTVSKGDAKTALELINTNMQELGASRVESDDSLAKVSVVGAGMVSDPGIAAKMFEAIHNLGVDIELITTSEIKISVLVKAENYTRTLQAVHDRFGLGS